MYLGVVALRWNLSVNLCILKVNFLKYVISMLPLLALLQRKVDQGCGKPRCRVNLLIGDSTLNFEIRASWFFLLRIGKAREEEGLHYYPWLGRITWL